MKVLIVHYSEIGTKGRNRRYFENHLKEDIQRRLSPRHVIGLRVDSCRLIGTLTDSHDPGAIDAAMAQVFGAAWHALGDSVSWAMDAIEAAVLAAADRNKEGNPSFKIFCTRADKTFPMTSEALARHLGGLVAEKLGLSVNLTAPELSVFVEIMPQAAVIYTRKVRGARGMPRATSGKMYCLFSGGIDSPVAAYLMMRRGAQVQLLHFHPFRRAEEVRDSKIFRLHKILREFNSACRLFLIPHFHYQVRAALEAPQEVEMVLFRRFMLLAAQALAEKTGAKALITGDSLGQVASQTVENLAAAQSGLSLPVFTPLIAQDKDEIIQTAQKIGTFQASVEPYKDCCSLLAKKPKTRAKVSQVRALEKKMEFEKLVEASLSEMEIWDGEKFNLPRSLASSEAAG